MEITKNDAVKLANDSTGWSKYRSYASISEEAAEILSTLSYSLDLGGIGHLSERQAKILARHRGGGLILSGLASLSEAVAEHLSMHEGYLDLSGLRSISDESGRRLSKHRGKLMLNGLTEVSDTMADFLSKHRGRLELNGIDFLTESATELLLRSEGDLILNGLKAISDKAAKAIVQTEEAKDYYDKNLYLSFGNDAPRRVVLNSVVSISHSVIDAFTYLTIGELQLNGLTNLDLSVAESMSKLRCALSLDGLREVSNDVAYQLGRSGCSRISLKGLRILSETCGLHLLNFHGELDLDPGILTDEFILSLAERNKGRYLNNLKTIDRQAARRVAHFSKGRIDLDGLHHIAEEIAYELMYFEGEEISLNGIFFISEWTARIFSIFPAKRLQLNGIRSVDPRVLRHLSKFEGTLSLNGVNRLSEECLELLLQGNLWSLELNGVLSLSDESCYLLSRVTSRIEFRGISKISEVGMKHLTSSDCLEYIELNEEMMSSIRKFVFAQSIEDGKPF